VLRGLVHNARIPCSAAAPAALSRPQTEQVQVTWEDQQNINTFSKLNMRRHEVEALIQATKVRSHPARPGPAALRPQTAATDAVAAARLQFLCSTVISTPKPPARPLSRTPTTPQKQLEDLEDASAELMLADEDDDGVRMRVGAAFLYTPKVERPGAGLMFGRV
jgi:chaperonin cofactor prefoldin